MALIRATSGSGGGGSLTPTTLWTNTATITSSYTFAGQSVALSDDIDNYDYLKFTFIRRNTQTSNKYSVIVSVEDFKGTSASASKFRGSVCSNDGSGNPYARLFYYNSDTSVQFGAVTKVGGSDNDNANNIPMLIEGLK